MQCLVPPWLGSRAPSKAPWHASRVLAWLTGGHQARPRATLAWLAGRHHARPRGTMQGPVAPWLGSWAGTMQGLVPPWLGSRAPSKAPWHASRVLAWLTGGHQGRPRGTCRVSWLGSRAGTMQGLEPPWLGSRAPSKAPWHLGLARGRAPCKALCHLGLALTKNRPRDYRKRVESV